MFWGGLSLSFHFLLLFSFVSPENKRSHEINVSTASQHSAWSRSINKLVSSSPMPQLARSTRYSRNRPRQPLALYRSTVVARQTNKTRRGRQARRRYTRRGGYRQRNSPVLSARTSEVWFAGNSTAKHKEAFHAVALSVLRAFLRRIRRHQIRRRGRTRGRVYKLRHAREGAGKATGARRPEDGVRRKM